MYMILNGIENVTYGDVWHANEVEQSVYNFELAGYRYALQIV